MSTTAQTIASQSQTVHVNNNNILEFVIERGPVLTVPIALVFFYKYFMNSMNNSMTNFSQNKKQKSANSVHKCKLAVSAFIFIIIVLVVFCLKK